MSNYPPGVTGSEPEIAGFPPCSHCGHEADDHNGDRDDDFCLECGCPEYSQYPQEPDPDELRDRQLDREWQRKYESLID